jgi:hypothetical protein
VKDCRPFTCHSLTHLLGPLPSLPPPPRSLRVVNPSPYMVYLQARGCILVASSPEILCRVGEDGQVTNRCASVVGGWWGWGGGGQEPFPSRKERAASSVAPAYSLYVPTLLSSSSHQR